MRHAITKLAHLHFAATEQSAERIRRMGERPEHVFVVGSPAIDGLAAIPVLSDSLFSELGRPDTVLLMHPVGRSTEREESTASAAIEAILAEPGRRLLALHPNFDPGRDGVLAAITAAGQKFPDRIKVVRHMPREQFVGLLKRLAPKGGLLVGNSSAALIEAAAVKLPAVDIGPRQAGRERANNVINAGGESSDHIASAIQSALKIERAQISHPYGDGSAGGRIAEKLSVINPHEPRLLRKRCAY
jgi:UDP-hydrolysing UDP-N-acetyl-D-glucosamine 2-epimerase